MSEARPIGDKDGLRFIRLSDRPDDLGESPLWDAEMECLWWIDGVAGLVRGLAFEAEEPAARHVIPVGGHIGSIALADRGRLLVARDHEFVLLDTATAAVGTLLALSGMSPDMRLNDGKADRRGRFICAGMGRNREPIGDLHQIDGALNHRWTRTALQIGNGVCFSPAGDCLYFSDTPQRKLFACDYDPDTGRISDPRLHIDTASIGSGIDGATVDRDGNIWAALIGIGEIGCFAPDGRLIRRFAAPTDLPSSLAFGGASLDRLFVTSIRDSRTGRAVSTHPDGGIVFAIDGTGATGIAEKRFELSTQILKSGTDL
ncbi:SMP-30/gluconolactonase/LRE family protein [Martelella mediterranea]|uniref:L-arabinolactonase n=1 Tax=Martelella mediterranea DSM 17316 TaxID=1122214 RepID=A0A1U9Z5N2_9HYPH|nr:SMP-30/gluconolactonase/LRE family protein [Martelella mediterranea]AQZ53029.1 L-arabinolactonase [Martelella mediterranea DSM 17316]